MIIEVSDHCVEKKNGLDHIFKQICKVNKQKQKYGLEKERKMENFYRNSE